MFMGIRLMFLSEAVTHWLVAIARVCSGMNMFEFGLGWVLTGICSCPNAKSCVKKVSGFGQEKSPATYFSFIVNSSKTQFKGIPASFPVLAGEIQMTMPRPNALHWPQPKIKEDIYIPGKKVWAVLLPCVVVQRLLCSLAKSFKQL
jgi:hypothetical protein